MVTLDHPRLRINTGRFASPYPTTSRKTVIINPKPFPPKTLEGRISKVKKKKNLLKIEFSLREQKTGGNVS